jgi:hypothetical protein
MSDVPEGSQRSKTIALGLLVLVAVAIALLVVRSSRPKPTPPVASASAKPAPPPAPSASVALPAEAALEAIPDLEGAYVGYDTLADGTKAPKLPDSAPQSVTFGVVVLSYAGAELAPATARTKEQAREKATAMIAEAKRDFSAAVAKGDRGSSANLGRLPRGMLEPAAEYVLFSLPKGEVASAPVDTPRGFWILRRID